MVTLEGNETWGTVGGRDKVTTGAVLYNVCISESPDSLQKILMSQPPLPDHMIPGYPRAAADIGL